MIPRVLTGSGHRLDCIGEMRLDCLGLVGVKVFLEGNAKLLTHILELIKILLVLLGVLNLRLDA